MLDAIIFRTALSYLLIVGIFLTNADAQEQVQDQWVIKELRTNDPYWTSVVFQDSLTELHATVYCQASTKAIGFQFSVPIDKGFGAIEELDTLHLRIDGQEVAAPAVFQTYPYEEFDWLTTHPPGVSSISAWAGQDSFLMAISQARLLIVESATSSENEALLLEIEQPIRLNGCTGDQFAHLSNLCGISLVSRGGFCRDYFCELEETARDRLMLALGEGQPQLFQRPNDEVVELADESYSALGNDGVLGFVESMCFASEE